MVLELVVMGVLLEMDDVPWVVIPEDTEDELEVEAQFAHLKDWVMVDDDCEDEEFCEGAVLLVEIAMLPGDGVGESVGKSIEPFELGLIMLPEDI